jgi:hypothetical protein
MINTFLYSVYGQGGGSRHRKDPDIAAYRHRWIDALLKPRVQAVIALGDLADDAWATWTAAHPGGGARVTYAKITHPTQPESSSRGDPTKHRAAIAKMLANWNDALARLSPAVSRPDVKRPLEPYADAFRDGERPPIPPFDLPAGTPTWMGIDDGWAARTGNTAAKKRATITVTVPRGSLP